MFVYFTDGSLMEGRLMGADQVGLEFELIRYMRQPDEGLPGQEDMDDELNSSSFLGTKLGFCTDLRQDVLVNSSGR